MSAPRKPRICRCGSTGPMVPNPLAHDGLSSTCRVCKQKQRKALYDANPEPRRAVSRKIRRRKYKADPEAMLKKHREWRKQPHIVERWRQKYLLETYGLTTEARDRLFESQGKCCAVCESKDPHHRRGWQVDHDHETGRVRGILCSPCNMLLGRLGDTTARVRETADRFLRYLA